MMETDCGFWVYTVIATLIFMLIVSVAKFLVKKNEKQKVEKGSGGKLNLPPGRRGWPLIGDSLNWYNAVASSHPSRFVQQQVQR